MPAQGICRGRALLPSASRPASRLQLTSSLHSGHVCNFVPRNRTMIKVNCKPWLGHRKFHGTGQDGGQHKVAAAIAASGRSSLAPSTKDDVVKQYIYALTEKVHALATDVKEFVPQEADEVLSEEQQGRIRDYISRYGDLLMLELDEEVKEFVVTLKDWPLDWLKQDGRVLLGLTGAPAGNYYGDQVVRFFVPGREDIDDDLKPLPRHSFSPGDMVLLTRGKRGPLVDGGWDPQMMYGVVTERSKAWIKVAFEAGPGRNKLSDCRDTWRLDQSVNTFTTERALLALMAMWHRVPFNNSTWVRPCVANLLQKIRIVLFSGFGSSSDASNLLKFNVDSFFESSIKLFDEQHHRRHMGVFEGSSLSDVVLMADKTFDWHSLPSEAGTSLDTM